MSNIPVYPYTYSAFGLDIASQIPVTGFESKTDIQPDIHIKTGDVPHQLKGVRKKGVLFEATDTQFLLHIENVASYHAINGSEIIVKTYTKDVKPLISAFIIGTVFGALLQQRGMIALHASTLYFNKKTLVFAGMSGSGKSTLAAAFLKKGGYLVADDVSVVDIRDKKPLVIPSFPCIKIWDDALKNLNIKTTSLTNIRAELKKYFLPVKQFHSIPTPADVIFVLAYHNKPDIIVQELHGADKFNALKKHTYMFRSIADQQLLIHHFQFIHHIARHLPVFLITRPSRGFNTDRLIEEIVGKTEFK